MGRSLGIETIAEGIETVEQADRMRALGCVLGQGYVFAAPMSEADLLATYRGGEAKSSPATESGKAHGRASASSRRRATPQPAANPAASRRTTALRPAAGS